MAAAASPDAARDRTSSLGGQYEKLLATVGNLQGDLQRTVGVCQVSGLPVCGRKTEVGRPWKYKYCYEYD